MTPQLTSGKQFCFSLVGNSATTSQSAAQSSKAKLAERLASRKDDRWESVGSVGADMGRKKIKIARINDERSRHATFAKRKNGLVKKAIELSILCDCEIALVIFNSQGKLTQYASGNIDQTLSKFIDEKPMESYTNDSVCRQLPSAVLRGPPNSAQQLLFAAPFRVCLCVRCIAI